MIEMSGLDFSGPAGFILSIFIGLCLGSFATALTYRIPRGLSWIASKGKAEHSLCPSCGHQLSWLDLFPLLSWISLRGKCRYCKAPIGYRYPAIELMTLLFCVITEIVFGFTGAGIVVMLAVPFLVAMIAIDLEFMILPDQINLILWAFGVVFICATSGPVGLMDALIAAIVYAGLSFVTAWILTKLLKKDAMGFGDVKFFAVAGLWLGLQVLPVFLMLAGVAGVVCGIFWKTVLKKEPFPFGPALILSFFFCLMFLPEIRGLLY